MFARYNPIVVATTANAVTVRTSGSGQAGSGSYGGGGSSTHPTLVANKMRRKMSFSAAVKSKYHTATTASSPNGVPYDSTKLLDRLGKKIMVAIMASSYFRIVL